ncbi:DNA-directed RNA polymerase subunit beta [Candidatus Manganitrophus noduliformans]|uniref:DNA-directed RNA polymerase subunit beta n=1 Tax=Candidatus Manganitrophus noduliformans TaxID=2606439 RepID=A0A7X6DPP1_9BACT|nr:DNA-directed RNA polymerase subunit beta [Candidatus Manganitrophus noduliformans]NKE71075.1 DNA-directed RNA polymerase subunit beta [Candidatus Manganitrophus noduliformans]
MAQSTVNGTRDRKDLSKISIQIPIPNLIEIQRQSYERFLQRDVPAEQREDIGLQSAFTSVFPISDYNDTAMIEFIDYSIGTPKYDVQECLERGMTFAAPLKIRVRLVVWDKEAKGDAKKVRDVREQEVYIGELPLMTENGTFLVNGTERVVVSQLQRSPGAAFTHDKGRTHASGKVLYSARIIPYRGSWLDFEFDAKDILYVRIDRRRKLPATILLKAFSQEEGDKQEKKYTLSGREEKAEGGSLEEAILKLFYPIEDVRIADGAFWRRLDSEIHAGIKAPTDFMDKKEKELLAKEGSKMTKGVLKRMKTEGIKEIPYPKEELIGRAVLNDIIDPNTGEVLLERNHELTDAVLAKIAEAGIKEIKLLYIDNIQVLPVIRDTLSMEKVASPDEAMVEIYRRLRPGETPTMETARVLFDNLFYNPKRYDLSPVGRLKLNKKLNLDLPLERRTLTAPDIVEVIRYLVNLKTGKGEIEDIDHLGNRRVRSVGELLENQFRIGLVRMERTIKERMNLLDLETVLPHDLINAKPVIAVIKEFFGSSQLSQFMDQTNPLAEITHKRRLSALGPGGLTRERAGFEVRDVHPSHYGRICPIETPEGPNIGLITSLATYARVNEFGFIESPYRKVKSGRVTEEIEFISAIDGDKYVIAQANTKVDGKGKITADSISARYAGDFVMVPAERVEYMDVSPKQIVSVATALIPFLENDDANRALMGSNMQRQAVPLIATEAPFVGTGMEAIVARDSGYVLLARRPGVIESVDATRIVVKAELTRKEKENASEDPEVALDVYNLIKFQRSNQNTCITQKPVVTVGTRVKKGDVLADGPAIDQGELALGRNVLVAFMPWGGYNFEDAILISERLVREDHFTSIHIEEFELEARDTKLGKEEITRDIPNVSEDALKNLDESGIIRIGAEVKPGDILVGKVTPKGETQLTPEEKLLRAIFGEKAGDVKDASLYVPPGIEGIVVDVKIFSRKSVEKDERSKSIENEDVIRLQRDHQDELRIIEEEKHKKIRKLLLGKLAGVDIVDPETGESLLKKKKKITKEILDRIPDEELKNVLLNEPEEQEKIDRIEAFTKEQIDILQTIYDEKAGRLKRGDELPPGVIKLVKVFIAMKRKLQVGDKMAGRHGNKGVVSRVLPEEDMPYLPDGTPVGIVLNPLGVPSRMNVGQILETHLGWAAKALGLHLASPVFDGATEREIKEMLQKAKLPTSGQTVLYDGKSGEPFNRPVTVGYMYMMKLHHLVDDKIHARSIGPYSLVTQQPLGGKAQFGGQRLGEMEVWALQAYGAASILQEFLTVKSDDVPGRSRIYEAIVKGENFLEPGLPESFNVLIKELQSLGLDVELIKGRE